MEEDEVHLEQLERLVEALHVLDCLLARVVELLVGQGLVHFGRRQQLARLRILVGVAQEVDKVNVLLALELLDVGAELGGKRLQHDEDLLGEPRLVLLVDELVREDAHALVLPQREQHERVGERLEHVDVEDALEDAREVAQVEEVVELGGRGEHLGLDAVPDGDGHRHEVRGHLLDGIVLGPAEAGARHGTEDLVDRGVRGQRHVHHVEVALGAVGDVVLARARVEHGAEDEHVDDARELARLVEAVEAAVLDLHAHDLEGNLVAPLVDEGHGDVVDEAEHALVVGRAEGLALALLDRRLDLALEDGGRGRLRERHLLEGHLDRVHRVEHGEDDRRLGRARAAHEDDGAVLRDGEAHDVLKAHRVDRRDEQRRKLLAQLIGLRGERPAGDEGAP